MSSLQNKQGIETNAGADQSELENSDGPVVINAKIIRIDSSLGEFVLIAGLCGLLALTLQAQNPPAVPPASPPPPAAVQPAPAPAATPAKPAAVPATAVPAAPTIATPAPKPAFPAPPKSPGSAAFEVVRLAAEKGDAAAQFKVAMMFAAGTEVQQDLPKAVEWLRMSASQTNTAAQFNLAVF